MKTTPKNKELIYFLLLFFSVNFSAQQKISITPPNNWTEFQRDEVMNTIYNKYSYSDKIKKELEENGNKSIQLIGYQTDKRKGLYRPNIQVILRPNSSNDIQNLKNDIDKSLVQFSKIIKDFKIVEQPEIIKIGDKHAVFMKFKGYNLTNENKKSKFETILIAIPVENIFYQITLNQSTDDNFNEDFEKVIKSIKFE